MSSVMVSAIILLVYASFLAIAGGGDVVEATIPEEFKSDSAPFSEGGFFSILADLAQLLIGILKLAWNMVVLMVAVLSVDLERFGLPPATGILRAIFAVIITGLTIHVLWEVTVMVRGSS